MTDLFQFWQFAFLLVSAGSIESANKESYGVNLFLIGFILLDVEVVEI